MTEQSQPEETTPSDVSTTEAEVQPEAIVEPENSTAEDSAKTEDLPPEERWRKLQSERDQIAAEKAKLEEDATYYRQEAEKYASAEQREQFLEQEKLRAIEQENQQLKQEREANEAAIARTKLVEDKYPQFKGMDFLEEITGSEDQIESALASLDDQFKKYTENLSSLEDGKESAESSSPAIEQLNTSGNVSYEEIKNLKPKARAKKMQEIFKSTYLDKIR